MGSIFNDFCFFLGSDGLPWPHLGSLGRPFGTKGVPGWLWRGSQGGFWEALGVPWGRRGHFLDPWGVSGTLLRDIFIAFWGQLFGEGFWTHFLKEFLSIFC